MGLTKYTKVEGTEVLSKQAHEKAEEVLRKQGKTSASELDDTEREQLTDALRQAE